MRFLKLGVFHQTTPPDPIKDSLDQLLILTTFLQSYSSFKTTSSASGHQGDAG